MARLKKITTAHYYWQCSWP